MPFIHMLGTMMMEPEFGYLESAQRDAIIEALMLTLVPPGERSDEERRRTRLQLLELPWAWEPDESSSDGLVCRAHLRLSRVEDADLLHAIGRGLARQLTDPRLREPVYRLMATLVYADGGTDRDVASLEPLRDALALTGPRASRAADAPRPRRRRGRSTA